MKYRTKHIAMIGYFAQVKRHIFCGWETIGSHLNNQVGEYPEINISHPLLSQGDAILLAHRHANLNNSKLGFTNYMEISL